MARGLLERRPMARARRTRRGFTLVELAVVVTIVGVLAVIAVVGYRKLISNSKVTEAQNMVGAIRIAEDAYKAEKGTYLSTGTNFCPQNTSTVPDAKVKTQWNPACASSKWAALPVHADGPVAFGYRVYAAPDTKPTITGVDLTNLATTKPWYVIEAACDIETGGLATRVVGTSMSNTPFVINSGE